MTWFERSKSRHPPRISERPGDKSHRRVRTVQVAVFAERTPAKKVVPAWIVERERHTSLSGWLSSRPGPPNGAGQTSEPRAGAEARPAGPSIAPEPIVVDAPAPEAIEAQILSHKESERALAVGVLEAPQPFESLAARLPEAEEYRSARAAEEARMHATIEALEKSLEELAALRRQIQQETEEQLVVLAGAIARRVIGRELLTDPEILLALASEGIEALGERDSIVVRIGKLDDPSMLASLGDRLRRKAPRCELVEDPILEPGQCTVETEFGYVDESVDARLASVLSSVVSAHKAPR